MYGCAGSNRIALLLASLLLAACGSAQEAAPGEFTTAYWYWSDYGAKSDLKATPLDALYVHAGDLHQEEWGPQRGHWSAFGYLNDGLPPARQYWIVFRCESPGVPPLDLARDLALAVANVLDTARVRRLRVEGVQLDIDSPTRALPEYAQFLKAVRTALRERQHIETKISITALLDWFRKGTAVASVIAEVDEFVPQFYDVSSPQGREASVSQPFDGATWGPVFGAFGKPYRVGISTFGRMRTIAAKPAGSYYGIGIGGLTPLDVGLRTVGSNPEFRLETRRNQAGEMQLDYIAQRDGKFSYWQFSKGDVIQFVLPDAEAVHKSAESARELRAPFAGLVFFRWPTESELLTLQPADVLAAADAGAPTTAMPPRVETVDGGCAVVHCVDVVLAGVPPLQPEAVTYRIRSSIELDYFIAEDGMPVRLNGTSVLELALPPYGARATLRLGRAVSENAATFTLEPQL